MKHRYFKNFILFAIMLNLSLGLFVGFNPSLANADDNPILTGV